MTISVVTPIDDPELRKKKWGEAADYLRDLAVKCETGELTDIVITYCNRDEKVVGAWTMFDDRWRIIGAMEYAKSCLMEG